MNRITEAVEGFKEVHPYKTEEEIAEFQALVEGNIKLTRDRSGIDIYRKNRHLDGERIKAKATENSILFSSVRKYEVEVEHVAGQEDRFTASLVMSNRGGATVAYHLRTNLSDNTLYIRYAVSLCRDDENFDLLMGKEISLDRLLTGNWWEVIAPQSFMRGRGLSRADFERMVREYKRSMSWETL